MSRSVYCSSCSKTYFPCPSTKSDSECCANACQTKPTLTPKKQKLGGQVRMKNGGTVPGMYYNI